jgi:rare lipoprotein A (peptidoglycan hydrolase)
MANGRPFNPDRLTAASWFYPLETRLIVTSKMAGQSVKRVMVTVTDRGPARRLVKDGRIIDLSHAAFAKLGSPALGLVEVSVRPERQLEGDTAPAVILPWLTSETSLRRPLFCATQGSGKPECDGVSVTPSAEQKKLP